MFILRNHKSAFNMLKNIQENNNKVAKKVHYSDSNQSRMDQFWSNYKNSESSTNLFSPSYFRLHI